MLTRSRAGLAGLARAGKLAQLAETANRVPVGDWVLEPKLDGARLLAGVEDDEVRLHGRAAGSRFDAQLHGIGEEISKLPDGTWLDGELVHLTVDGPTVTTDWGAVQSVISSSFPTRAASDRLTYIVFDLLAFDGLDARPLPFVDRRVALERALEGLDSSRVQLAPQADATEAQHEAFLRVGFEGSMAKRLDAPYRGGRQQSWLKLKPTETIDAIVTGWEPADEAGGFAGLIGALVFSQPHPETDKLVERGKVGTGFTVAARERMTANFEDYHGRVIEVRHMGAQPSGRFRSPVLARFRDDKGPEEVEWHDR